MMCAACRTLNPDHNRTCMRCNAALLPPPPAAARKQGISRAPKKPKPLKTPAFFTLRRKFTANLFGTALFLLPLPVFISLLVLAELNKSTRDNFIILLVVNLIFIIVYFIACIYFLPFIHNHYLMKYFSNHDRGFVSQVTFKPRLYSGIEASLEDADDVGVITFEDNSLIFNGDSFSFKITKSNINSIEFKPISISGILPGKAVHISLKTPLEGTMQLFVHPRMGRTFPGARRLNAAFCEAVRRWED